MEEFSKFEKSPVDHFIQKDIVKQLYNSSNDLKFSDLKPEGIENSLFMYHVRKLISRGVIEKTEEGFSLTDLGTRWCNFIDVNTLKPVSSPKILINLIVTDRNNSKILLAKRLKKSSEVLNEYLIPGDNYRYGLTRDENVRRLASYYNATDEEPVYVGVFEVLNQIEDKYIHHTISVLYHLKSDTNPEDSDLYAYEWAELDKVSSLPNKYGQDVSSIVNQYKNKKTFNFDSLAI